MTGGLSERSRQDCKEFVESLGSGGSQPVERELLYRFLIGVHRRGEELYAHELKTLLDDARVDPEVSGELISFIEPALGLLHAYDVAASNFDDEDGFDGGGEFDVGPGIMVI